MTAVIVNEEENIGIDYVESCVPPMLSGEYQICVTQKVNELGDSVTETQTFLIDGPRFNLAEADVESVYPPEGMKGSFGLTLPHIGFNRKTLPWERSPMKESDSSGDNEDIGPRFKTPWLALLLLCGDEILDVKTEKAGKIFWDKPDNVYISGANAEIPDEEEVCRYIDIKKELFIDVMPKPHELIFLCHTRRVNIYLQSSMGENQQPELRSVLIGNRLPKTSKEGTKNRAYIVSLENYIDADRQIEIEKYYSGYKDARQECIKEDEYSIDEDYARLTVLYSWDFYSTEEQYHIKDIFDNLSIGNLTYPNSAKEDTTKAILAHGFVPLAHKFRNGNQTVSFYRGPFTTDKLEDAKYTCDSADSLYKYDPAIGMFDVSYAAAWQEGRMLTLNSKAIAIKIMRLRSQNLRKLNRVCANENLGTMLNGTINDDTVSEKTGSKLLDYLNKETDSLKDILIERMEIAK